MIKNKINAIVGSIKKVVAAVKAAKQAGLNKIIGIGKKFKSVAKKIVGFFGMIKGFFKNLFHHKKHIAKEA